MVTLTIEIKKDRDVSALIELIEKLGLNYHIDTDYQLHYTDETKKDLEQRYSEYSSGEVEMVSAEESKAEIDNLLNNRGIN